MVQATRQVYFCPKDITCVDDDEVYFDRDLHVIIIVDRESRTNVRVLDIEVLHGKDEEEVEHLINVYRSAMHERGSGRVVAQWVDPGQLIPVSVSDEEIKEAIDSIMKEVLDAR
jgi:hypothetical protein